MVRFHFKESQCSKTSLLFTARNSKASKKPRWFTECLVYYFCEEEYALSRTGYGIATKAVLKTTTCGNSAIERLLWRRSKSLQPSLIWKVLLEIELIHRDFTCMLVMKEREKHAHIRRFPEHNAIICWAAESRITRTHAQSCVHGHSELKAEIQCFTFPPRRQRAYKAWQCWPRPTFSHLPLNKHIKPLARKTSWNRRSKRQDHEKSKNLFEYDFKGRRTMGFHWSHTVGGHRAGATLRADKRGLHRPVFHFSCCGLRCFR